ncbi:cytochrome P450 [Irpex lacteus]|nr:cytochrome P450 [Irpex lacteus]
MNSYSTLGSLGLFTLALVVHVSLRRRRRLPLPPGPPADPIIGHLRVFPSANTIPEALYELSLKYGDVFSLCVPGKTIIVLSSEKAASDLLDKRSAIYSDRPRFAYYERIGWGDSLFFAPYGPFHTKQRKIHQDALGKNVVHEHRGIQEREANALLRGLLVRPNEYDRHAQRFAGGVITDISYGHRIDSFDDEFFYVGQNFVKIAGQAALPTLLDLHPIFAYLPSWAPGAWYIKFIKETKAFMDAVMHDNYRKVVDQVKAGIARPSVTANHLEAMYAEANDQNQEEHDALKMAAAMIFAAGFETTWHAVTIFIAAMLLHPDVQRKAQQEIDRAIGRDRLPDLNDRDSLPWQPVIPAGLPHRVMVEDTYNGMRIPKGSIIVANARAMTWDKSKFHEPELFKPERFLPKPDGAGEEFSENAAFGWGRRICPGRFLAKGSTWTAMARVLSVFAISPMTDSEGREVKPEIKFVTNTSRFATFNHSSALMCPDLS